MAKGVPGFTDQQKERALEMIRQNPQIPIADLERRTNIPGTTLARWRKEVQDEAGNMGSNEGASSEDGAKPQKLTERQRLQALELQNAEYLRTMNVQHRQLFYLRQYAKASDDLERKEIEIQYLLAVLVEYGCDRPERLSAEEPPEGE